MFANRRDREIPAPPLGAPTLNLNPLDAGQKRDTQFLVHIFIENPIDDRLFHQKGLVERQKFLFRLLIIGLGLNMLGVTKLKVMNYVPAVFVAIGVCYLF